MCEFRTAAAERGDKYYSTGRPCRRGHNADRLTNSGACTVCGRENAARWRAENAERAAANAKRWRDANLEKHRESFARWYAANPQKNAEHTRAWRAANPDKHAARKAKRRAAQLRRTPAWLDELDLRVIAAVYRKAKELTEATGTAHHVDHIVPLQGEFASGLHVPWNLQVLTAAENSAKGARFSAC